MKLTSGLLTSADLGLTENISASDLAVLRGTILLYAFGGCKQRAVKQLVSHKQLPWDYVSWKRTHARSGDLLKYSKMYLYALVCGSNPSPKKYSLTQKEANALARSLDHSPLSVYLNRLRRRGFPSYSSPEEADKIYARTLLSRDLSVYTSKFVYAKLRFLAKSYGQHLSDLKDQLITGAYVAFLRQYPAFENEDHFIKLAKTAVHNSGTNLIISSTREKRNVLVEDEHGQYSSLKTSITDTGLSYDVSSNENFTQTSLLVTGLDGAVHSNWESIFALRQLVASNKVPSRYRTLLKLMLGQANPDFEEFLGSSQTDLYEDDYDLYFTKVIQFMNTTESNVQKAFAAIRPLL